MRVLLDQECTAVAGGSQAECERNVELAGIATGAVIGGVAGGMAFGIGAVPGTLAGAGVGSLVAQVAGPPLCRWDENRRSEDDDSDVEEGSASGNPFRAPSHSQAGAGGNVSMDSGAPLQLVVSTSDF